MQGGGLHVPEAWAVARAGVLELGTDRRDQLGRAQGGHLWGSEMNWWSVWFAVVAVMSWLVIIQAIITERWLLALVCLALFFVASLMGIFGYGRNLPRR